MVPRDIRRRRTGCRCRVQDDATALDPSTTLRLAPYQGPPPRDRSDPPIQRFFRAVRSPASPQERTAQTRTRTRPRTRTLSAAIRAYADGSLPIVAQHSPPDGALAEQFDRASWAPASAADLTWSYAAALTAFRARMGGSGGAWGARGLKVVC
jgi:hypothetical protein